MSININLTSNIIDAVESFAAMPDKIIVQSTRRAINRALTTGRKEAAMSLRERLNIKSKDVKRKIAKSAAKSSKLRSLEGNISFSDRPMPLLDFVRGSKSTIKQKGLKVKKRRKIRVEITKGKKFIMASGFIQKVRSKQLFKRGNSGRLYKQSAPSIAEFAGRDIHQPRIQKAIVKSFNKNLLSDMSFRIDREAQKIGNGRMIRL